MPTEPQSGFHTRHMEMASKALERVQTILQAGGYVDDLLKFDREKLLDLSDLFFEEMALGDFDLDALVDQCVFRFMAEKQAAETTDANVSSSYRRT